MNFRIDAQLPATAAQLWAIFFDVQRVAGLIPGCENVAELEPLKEYSAVMKQRIGPFKLEVPTRISVESYTVERSVALRAAGRDKFTGTTIDVRLKVDLDEQGEAAGKQCALALDAEMQVAGRLASLGYPIVKKRSEELFAEFERRLRAELAGVGGGAKTAVPPAATAAERAEPPAVPLVAAMSAPAAAFTARVEHPQQAQAQPAQRMQTQASAHRHRAELVFVWPRVGISFAIGIAVAHGAVAFGQSPWWWLVAPLLGLAAGLDRRQD